jgi:hypothetical protein
LQARFLLNHLRTEQDDPFAEYSEPDLKRLILQANAPSRQIETSELREAKAGLGWFIGTASDAAYVFSCANLLDAALNDKLCLYSGKQKLAREVYSFKAHLGRALDAVVQAQIDGVRVYVAGKGLWRQSENVVFEQSSSSPAYGGQRRMKMTAAGQSG